MKKLYLLYLISSLIFSTPVLGYTCPNNYTPHILVNPTHSIDPNYVPRKPTIPDVPFVFSGWADKQYMDYEAAAALEKLFSGAKNDDIHLIAISGYRSYERQKYLYNTMYEQYGDTLKGNAKPGESEHQTGLAMDLSAASVDYALVQTFEYTLEGQWLSKHAHEYGFIIRYPKDMQHITGYMYEPWHIRYVGKELAQYIFESKLTLDEIKQCCFY